MNSRNSIAYRGTGREATAALVDRNVKEGDRLDAVLVSNM
jgi:hypothetical protein